MVQKGISDQHKSSINNLFYDSEQGHLYFNENGKEKGWGNGGLHATFEFERAKHVNNIGWNISYEDAPQLTASDFSIV